MNFFVIDFMVIWLYSSRAKLAEYKNSPVHEKEGIALNPFQKGAIAKAHHLSDQGFTERFWVRYQTRKTDKNTISVLR